MNHSNTTNPSSSGYCSSIVGGNIQAALNASNQQSFSSKDDDDDDDKSNDDDYQHDNGDQRVIACLFNKGELKSVFNHDYAFNNTDVVTVSRMDREAREEAEELQKQLTASRRQYM